MALPQGNHWSVARKHGALLDAQHVSSFITRFCQIEDWDAEPALEARDDTAAEKGDRIVEP